MASITRRQRARTAESRRGAIEAKLLQATERLLSDGTPYTELSIQQLCSEAGIARSTFYVYFRDKGDLVSRLGEEMVGQLARAASAWWSPGADRPEVLAATTELIRLYQRHGPLLAALTETAAYDPELRVVQEEMVQRYAKPLEQLVEHGRGRGAVRDIHPRETVSSLAWMVQGACYHLGRNAGEEEIERLAEALTAIVWHSLFPDRGGGVR
jgi:AcrR family transcriptional regulator